MIILLLLTLSFHLTNIAAIACDRYNITNFFQNDTLTVNFLTNNLLKSNRKVQCTSTSPFESVNGCVHHCNQLGYGQHGIIFVEMQYDNGTNNTCSIEYIAELQPPSLAYLNITNNKVQLGINRPTGSFDYVNLQCSDNESYIIFNTSMSLNNSLATIECSFLKNMPLMSFVLETIKKDFNPAVNHIQREIPLPITFTHSLNSRLLSVIADAPPPMTIYSTYEFQLIFYNKTNENISYERIKVSNLQANFGATFMYGLIPNVDHIISFKHIVDSIGYAQSNLTIPPIWSIPYPFEVTNLRLKEEYQNIILNWTDTHEQFDPVEYIVLCNSTENSMRNVGRNTTYICENTTFNETNIITVRTQVAIPGYIHDRIAVVQINVQQIPEIPLFDVFNKTETSITIRWNFINNPLIINPFEYNINCGLNQSSIRIDIRSNEYQCQSLIPGTLYVIQMSVDNLNNTIQRSKSIHGNTLLEKCQYQNHFYSPDLNGTRSVIIEWNPPEKNFDQIEVHCPSSYITFEYPQTMPIMFVKCIVTNGVQFNVTFVTLKSGYEWAILQFTSTPPNDLTTTIPPTTMAATTTTSTTMGAIPISSTIVVTATMLPTRTSTTGISSPITATQRPSETTATDCSQDGLLKTQAELTKWRTAAIVAFIVTGFLVLATICLAVLSTLLCLRNRYNGE